jgi:hypothetical protein
MVAGGRRDGDLAPEHMASCGICHKSTSRPTAMTLSKHAAEVMP